MKSIAPFLLGLMICTPSFADYSDGFITTGEYEGFVSWSSSSPPLIVDGGGANVIEMRMSGRLEVRSTSFPINENWHTGGITDIVLLSNSHLDYLSGVTEEITISTNATADLYGGRIDAITSMQFVGWVGRDWIDPHIDLYCRPGWSWLLDGQDKIGITGLWGNSISFSIEFINDEDYNPVWENINIIEIPEPTSLVMLTLGSLLIRRKK